MWSGFWFHTSMQSSKHRYIPYNLGLKIVITKQYGMLQRYFQVTCLPAKWRRRHRACILSCYHYWNQKHWPTLTNHRKAMEMKTNKTKLYLYQFIFRESNKKRKSTQTKKSVLKLFQEHLVSLLEFSTRSIMVVLSVKELILVLIGPQH